MSNDKASAIVSGLVTIADFGREIRAQKIAVRVCEDNLNALVLELDDVRHAVKEAKAGTDKDKLNKLIERVQSLERVFDAKKTRCEAELKAAKDFLSALEAGKAKLEASQSFKRQEDAISATLGRRPTYRRAA